MLIIEHACLVCHRRVGNQHALPRICRTCEERIPFILPQHIKCTTCGRAIACPDCQRPDVKQRAFERNRSAVTYNDEMKAWLRLYKFRGEQRLAAAMAQMLIAPFEAILRAHNLSRPLLVPVPLSPSRAHERGFNQAEQLAKHVAFKTAHPLVPLLTRSIETEKQSLHGRMERLRQLDDVFQLDEHVMRCSKTKKLFQTADAIIVIDDVFTTGSTLASCAKRIKTIQKIPIFCLTWARS